MSVKVLILDNDKKLGESLKHFLSNQKNVNVQLVHTAEKAEYLMSFNIFDLIIVELVLSSVTGVDFLNNLIKKKLLYENSVVWCMSSILDHNFISNQSFNKYVDKFFKKPLDMVAFKQAFSSKFDLEEYKKYLHFFYINQENNISCTELLKTCKFIESHHLMFVYLHLCVNRFSGTIDVTDNTKKQVVKFFFKDGKIFHLHINHRSTYLGALLEQNNIISSSEIKKAIANKGHKLLGSYLIEQCIVSPHEIQTALKKQFSIYLSQTLDHQYSHVSYSNSELKKSIEEYAYVDLDDLMLLLDDWCMSKVDIDWIRNFFINRKDMILSPSKNSYLNYTKGEAQLFNDISINSIKKNRVISDIISQSQFQSDAYVRILYYRLLVKNCYLIPSSNTKDEKSILSYRQEMELKKLDEFIKNSSNKNYFKLLNLPENATNEQIEAHYKSIIKTLHPDHIGDEEAPALRMKRERCLSIINTAYHTLSNRESRRKYITTIINKKKSHQKSSQTDYNQARKFLDYNMYEKAFQKFSDLLKHPELAPQNTILYHTWADLKRKNTKIDMKEKQLLFASLQKVQSHCPKADFSFVEGLLLKQAGSSGEASMCFKKSLLINPNMVAARQEMYFMNQSLKSGGKKKWSFKNLFKFSA